MLPVHDWRDKGQYTEVAIMLVKCLILLQVSLVLIGPSSMVTASQEYPFVAQPENSTVNFGEFVEFECRVNNTHQTELELFIGTSVNGSTQIYPHQRSGLRAIEFSVNVTTNSVRNENIGKAVIIINSQTLQLVEYFFCKVFGDGWIVKRSRKAYISIVYPECTPFLHQLTYPPKDLDTSPIPLPQELTYPPKGLNTSPMQLTPSQTYNFGCQRVITKPAYILEPCKHQLTSLDHSFSYKVAVGVLCAGMVLLVLVFVIILCICVSRRKQLKPVVKRTNNVCNNTMVPNPIYDGPLYESVQPQFESLVSGVAAANNDHLHDDLQFESTTSLDSIAGKSRYVSSPGLIQSGSFSTYCNDDHSSTMEQQLPDDNGCCACTTSLNDNKMLQNKEDAYTVMNPAGTLTHSALSGGWSEQEPDAKQGD